MAARGHFSGLLVIERSETTKPYNPVAVVDTCSIAAAAAAAVSRAGTIICVLGIAFLADDRLLHFTR